MWYPVISSPGRVSLNVIVLKLQCHLDSLPSAFLSFLLLTQGRIQAHPGNMNLSAADLHGMMRILSLLQRIILHSLHSLLSSFHPFVLYHYWTFHLRILVFFPFIHHLLLSLHDLIISCMWRRQYFYFFSKWCDRRLESCLFKISDGCKWVSEHIVLS